MPLNSPRLLILQAPVLAMIISAAAIGLGMFLRVSMNGSNSGINLLAGAALLVADLGILTKTRARWRLKVAGRSQLSAGHDCGCFAVRITKCKVRHSHIDK